MTVGRANTSVKCAFSWVLLAFFTASCHHATTGPTWSFTLCPQQWTNDPGQKKDDLGKALEELPASSIEKALLSPTMSPFW